MPRIACDKCGAFDGHGPNCPNQTPEDWIKSAQFYYKAWLAEVESRRNMTDIHLSESSRTQANLWKAKYFEACRELAKCNKGIRRLNGGIKALRKKLSAPSAT